ncbi:MAG TPA: hypothetical protein VF263_08785, partial [Longimicrobiaceae bacterium]
MERPVPTTDPEARLADLAAEGRQRQAAALALEEAEARRIERRERREAERMGRGNVLTALVESPRAPALPLLRIFTVLLVASSVLAFASEELGLGHPLWRTAGLAVFFGAAVGYFPARWLAGRWYFRRERAWLLSLPFPVRGYFRALGSSPEEERTLRLRIAFRDAAPDRELLEGLLGRVTFPATATLTGGSGPRWTAESGPIRS